MEFEKKRILSLETARAQDRIEGDTIVLNSRGLFPKKVLFINGDQLRFSEYRLVKTRAGKLSLQK
jgi:hemin uptake protein HemP